MKTPFRWRLLVPCMVGLGFLMMQAGVPGQSSADVDLSTIEVTQHPQAVLTTHELQTVVRLARQSGIQRVARINVHNVHPSPYFSIGVTSEERIVGREVSFDSVSVRRQGWVSDKTQPSAKARMLENFWSEPEMSHTTKLTVFTAGKETFRIRLGKDMPVSEADVVVAALIAGKIDFATAKDREPFERWKVNMARPVELAKRKEGYFVAFQYDRFTTVSGTVRLVNGRVVISDVMVMMA